jgi:large conductance mechanosensitive channel
MGLLSEFKDFIMKGNIVDLAVAVIIGGAFGKIITSLVDDVITPMLLKPALEAANADEIGKLTWGSIKYGNFLSTVISFIIIAFVLFMILKGMSKAMAKKEEAPAPTPANEVLLAEIRDLLKK